MSTILKALRRLEEDSSIDASSSLPATNPLATDELRNRILAEESAAEAGGSDMLDPTNSKKRVWIVIAIAGATVAIGLIVGLVLGLNSPTPDDDKVEAVAVVSPVQLPSASRSPTPAAVSDEQRASADGRSVNASAAGTGIGIVAVPVIQSDNPPPNARTNQASPANATPPGLARPAPLVSSSPSSAPEEPSGRQLPKSTAPARPEEMALAAVVPTAAVLETESLAADSVSSGIDASQAPTIPSAIKSRPQSTPTGAQRQATKPPAGVSAATPAAVSAAKPPAKPPADPPIKTTRENAPEAKPQPSTESTAKPTAPVVEEHKGRAIPDVTVLRTAWHPSPDRRSAKIRLLDTKETLSLKEGDAVGGLVVQEISPSAVIFRSGEIEIRLRVGQP